MMKFCLLEVEKEQNTLIRFFMKKSDMKYLEDLDISLPSLVNTLLNMCLGS